MIKIGVLCPSEIAFRRFMPALKLHTDIEFVGLAVCNAEERFGEIMPCENLIKQILDEEQEKAKKFIDLYGGKIYDGYNSLILSEGIDAIYIPLPPALHFKWAKKALEAGKHVLVEKPATISLQDSRQLVDVAASKGLALHENYMFVFHNQLKEIQQIVHNGEIGTIRLYNIKFGFPRRNLNDFRYKNELGGGALIDAGGYTIKYASLLLGETAQIVCAKMNYTDEFSVDLFGSGTLMNDKGTTVQIAFGMDNSYKCELEVWGSKGCLRSNRILTAPAGFTPKAVIIKDNIDTVITLPEDDTFYKSISYFKKCIKDNYVRQISYKEIIKQAEYIDNFQKINEQGNTYVNKM